MKHVLSLVRAYVLAFVSNMLGRSKNFISRKMSVCVAFFSPKSFFAPSINQSALSTKTVFFCSWFFFCTNIFLIPFRLHFFPLLFYTSVCLASRDFFLPQFSFYYRFDGPRYSQFFFLVAFMFMLLAVFGFNRLARFSFSFCSDELLVLLSFSFFFFFGR